MAVTMVSDRLYDTIGTRFERQAAATPDNLAVVTDELSLTYRELDAMASRIAGGLAVLPSDSDRPVALLMSEGPFLYAAMLGATKAGRTFFVLPVTSPEPWLSALVATPLRHISLQIIRGARSPCVWPGRKSTFWRSSGSRRPPRRSRLKRLSGQMRQLASPILPVRRADQKVFC